MNKSDSHQDQAEFERGPRFIPQGIGGYDECWYPVCLSDEVARGEVKGFEYLNGKVIIFRPEQGELSAMSAYCRHLGVDLSLAKVMGETVRCPYHHWEYDRTGQCVKTASGDTPPTRARLFKFPATENNGLIWVYNGSSPAYGVPAFPVDTSEMDLYVCRAVEVPMDPFMLYSNSMDLQHLISLHDAQFDKLPEDFDIRDRSISYTQDMTMPRIGNSRQTVTLFGTNCITLCSEIKGRQTFMMSAGLAVIGPLTRTFNVAATLKTDSKLSDRQPANRHLDRVLNKLHIRMVDAFGKKLNEEDDPVFRSMSPRLDNLTSSDKALSIYFDYVRNYPRSNIAEDLICNDYIAGAPKKRLAVDILKRHPL